MGNYIPNSSIEQQELLQKCNLANIEDLFAVIPDSVLIKEDLNIPKGKSELEVSRFMDELASKNKVYKSVFRGAGAYKHYIPAVVSAIISKEEFITAYTPYQAEISQGVLQAIFEFQTMICSITAMDVANASVYDGATATAEAVAMFLERKRKNTVYISKTTNPDIIEVVKTYCFGRNIEVVTIPEKDGLTDLDALKEMLNPEMSSFIVQQPNFYGNIEDVESIAHITHEAKGKFIMNVNPLAAAIIPPPGEVGADIAVGEAQPFGIPLSFGGPYIGFMATKSANMRKLPGRLVGQTEDVDGKRAFVLTLQAREQHIRREKASSNVCSNQQLCALTVSAYLSAMGPEGIKQAALQSVSKAHYMAKKLAEVGLSRRDTSEFFHEFVTVSEKSSEILSYLEKHNILGGLQISDSEILWCATELNSKEEIDYVAKLVKEV